MSRSVPTRAHRLTPLQAGMVYESHAQGAGVNVEQVVIHLQGGVDLARMAQAWEAAIERHPALRLAVWQAADGQFVQGVGAAFAAPLVTENLRGSLADWLGQDRARGVDVARADGWRLAVLTGGSGPVLVWTFSHVALDGRSFAAVLAEVFACYDGVAQELPARPSFVEMCEGLAAQDRTGACQMFGGYLQGFDAATPVGFAPVGFDTVLDGPSRTVSLRATLTPAQSAKLVARASSAGASFATMVQAAWGLVLARVSGQGDVVFGITRSGRYVVPGVQDMVGCLITTEPLRMRVTPATTLDALLARIRADLTAQRPHEGVGLPAIAKVSDIPNSAPMFHSLVMVERQSLHEGLQRLGGAWAKRRVELHEQGAMPLTLAAYGDAALQVQLEYMPSRISAKDADRYLGYVGRLLVAMADAPAGALLSDLSMLAPEETAGLMALSQPVTLLPTQRPATIAKGFEAVVARAPDAPALGMMAQAGGLDFAALDRRANQLAHSLLSWGIGADAIIGLCLPRGPEFVALMLAAAKLGAAFVPMDPSYPPEALVHMAEDSAVAMIFAQTATPWMADFAVTVVTEALGQTAPTTAPTSLKDSAERAAYAIYTSGTTGKPKGVAVAQRSLVAHGFAAIAAYGLTAQDRVLQFSALSFDVALEEIVPCLLAGAKLVLRDDAVMASPQAFVDGVAEAKITVLNLPTGFWQVLLGALEAGTATLPADVRLVIVGGERMPPDAWARWHATKGLPRLMNAYGPTEATITCAMYEQIGAAALEGLPKSWGGQVAVGRSFGHALTYLRAPDGSLAPMGARAELWVGGDAVALGYLNQPQLTAERFVANPYAPGRMYRSGDMAHWAEGCEANGGEAGGDEAGPQLVIAGRSDRQIKLRGFRIEPAEVEGVLERLAGVAQAHVGVVDQRLAGWLRPSDATAVPDVAAVAAHLAQHLAKSHCPEVVFVTDWPQTPSGKTDVRRLPAPARVGMQMADTGKVDPQVTKIAQLFGRVLGGDVPPAGASFFDLGGHSLQLLTLIGQIETAFGVRLALALAQVHGAPTPLGLSALIAAQKGRAVPVLDLAECVMPIQPLGAGIPIYGVHVLGVNGSFFRPLAKAMGPDQPIFGLTVGLLSADTPTSVKDTAALYFRAVQAHRPNSPVGLVAVSLGSFMALELAQQLRAAGRDVRLLAMMDAEGPGGRENIRGLAWLKVHGALLRKGGLGHLSELIGGKVESLRHRGAKLRLWVEARVLRDTRAVTSVDRFVAANAMAIQSYDPRSYAGRMTIIRAKGNPFDSDRALQSGLGWRCVAKGGFVVVDVVGDHLSILQEPGVVEVAATLATELGRADATRA